MMSKAACKTLDNSALEPTSSRLSSRRAERLPVVTRASSPRRPADYIDADPDEANMFPYHEFLSMTKRTSSSSHINPNRNSMTPLGRASAQGLSSKNNSRATHSQRLEKVLVSPPSLPHLAMPSLSPLAAPSFAWASSSDLLDDGKGKEKGKEKDSEKGQEGLFRSPPSILSSYREKALQRYEVSSPSITCEEMPTLDMLERQHRHQQRAYYMRHHHHHPGHHFASSEKEGEGEEGEQGRGVEKSRTPFSQ
jgi:hypothetical protein